MKALFVQEAEEAGNTGPDYQFGYGIVQARETIDRMRTRSLVEEKIAQGESDSYFLIVPNGDSLMKATLVWDDYPGTANADPVLVNDLDLVVTDPEGTRHYPWTLDPDNPADDSVRNDEDHRNNIEQVQVESPVEGLWAINVTGTIPEGAAVTENGVLEAVESETLEVLYIDADDDGRAGCNGSVDCDDSDPATYPEADEVCDGIDNDCDGPADDEDPDCYDCWDIDGDGYDDTACGGDDCNDSDPAVHPGMAGQDCLETQDTIDNDCDGQIDEDKCQGCFIGVVM